MLSRLQRRLILSVTTIAFACSGTPAQSPAPPHTDNQIWTEYQLAIPLNHKTDIVALGVLRFGRNVSQPVNERIGAGVSRKIGKYLTIFPSYLHVASQPTPLNHSTEERITLEATPKFPLAGRFTFSDRNRVEFHFHSVLHHFTQYRNRPRIEHPFHLGKSEFEVFIADEVFYDSLASSWIRNRFYVGAGKKMNEHVFLELYYVRQNDGRSRPGDINALGSLLRFRL